MPPTCTAIGRPAAKISTLARSIELRTLPKRSAATRRPARTPSTTAAASGASRHGSSTCGPSDASGTPRSDPRRRRREPVAALEGAADLGPRIARLDELDDRARRRRREDAAADAVVGTDVDVQSPASAAIARRIEPTPGSTTATNDRARGKVRRRRREVARAFSDVVRRDVVRQVDDREVGANVERRRPSSRRRRDRGCRSR